MYTVIDLFTGAGGLTYGFDYKLINSVFHKRNQFKFIFANEFDAAAVSTFKHNFPDIRMLHNDIRNINEHFLRTNNIHISKVDVVIGGPPCQAFSTIGKRKKEDERHTFFKDYARILKQFQPKIFLFENVLGILSFKNDKDEKVFELIQNEFLKLGYTIEYRILNAQDYGIPQMRKRVFIVGVKNGLETFFEFPKETNSLVTLRDAISDLGEIHTCETESKVYSTDPVTDYQKMMRSTTDELCNHRTGFHSEKMLKIMEALKEGEAKNDINKKVENKELPEYCYLTSGYANTYGRLWYDRVCTTITNSLSSPSCLRCIHPKQNRPLTSREGARIQSFPDDFKFFGTKAEVNKQIGNAVPPILSSYFADEIYEFLERVKNYE